MKFDKTFLDSEEKFLKTITIYGDKANGNVFADAAKTKKINKDTLKNLFILGVTINFSDQLYAPITFKDNGADASILIHNGTTATTFYSSEHEAG